MVTTIPQVQFLIRFYFSWYTLHLLPSIGLGYYISLNTKEIEKQPQVKVIICRLLKPQSKCGQAACCWLRHLTLGDSLNHALIYIQTQVICCFLIFTQGGDKAMSHSAHRPLCSLRQLSWHAQRWRHHCGVGGIHTLKQSQIYGTTEATVGINKQIPLNYI